jgi:predicted RNA-binding protein
MSKNVFEKEEVLVDPTAELEAAKLEITQQISAAKLLLKQEQKKLRGIEKLDIEVITDKNTRIAQQTENILKLNDAIAELEFDLKSYNRSREDENEEHIQAALFKVAEWLKKDSSAAFVIERGEYVYVDNYSITPQKPNVLFRNIEPNKFIQELAVGLGIKIWHLPAPRVIDLFNSVGRTYHMSRYSIDSRLWNSSKVYLPIKHMEPYFINRDEVEGEYSEYFDWLMYSLSGGKLENQEHIERWIVHKVINYSKAVTTPDIVIVGHVGGNGKGILQAIVRLMFPASLSGKATTKTLKSQFTAILVGKLIVFFDDQDSKEISLDVVKQMAGAETMVFEEKGKDQYEAEKTHSSAWFAQELPFRLTPGGKEGGVDRRFSIMRTNITFLESIRKHYKTDKPVTVEESKDVAENIVKEFLINRVEVAKWFKHLQAKYPEIDESYTLKALHGEDYQYFLDQQNLGIDKVWDKLVVPVLKEGGAVPLFVIKELVRHLETNHSDKKIANMLRTVIDQSNMSVVVDRQYMTITPSIVNKTKQFTVVRPKSLEDWTNRDFDWSLVSRTPYNSARLTGTPLIQEDDFCFGAPIDDVAIPVGIAFWEDDDHSDPVVPDYREQDRPPTANDVMKRLNSTLK